MKKWDQVEARRKQLAGFGLLWDGVTNPHGYDISPPKIAKHTVSGRSASSAAGQFRIRPLRSGIRAVLSILANNAALGLPHNDMLLLGKDIGLSPSQFPAPTVKDSMLESVSGKRTAKRIRQRMAGHCPACNGTVAHDSPCMRRSCELFNKNRDDVRRWEWKISR